jgi:hypothetical protein
VFWLELVVFWVEAQYSESRQRGTHLHHLVLRGTFSMSLIFSQSQEFFNIFNTVSRLLVPRSCCRPTDCRLVAARHNHAFSLSIESSNTTKSPKSISLLTFLIAGILTSTLVASVASPPSPILSKSNVVQAFQLLHPSPSHHTPHLNHSAAYRWNPP